MPLVHLSDMIDLARKDGFTLAAQTVRGLPTLRKAVAHAEADRAPLILAVSCAEHSADDMELLLPAVEAAARKTKLPSAVLVTHCSSRKKAVAAVRLGATALAGDEDRIAEIAEATGATLVTKDDPISAKDKARGDSDGKAKALLKAARPWRNVRHLITFNAAEDMAPEAVAERLRTGVDILSRIPGVRSCMAGERVAGKDDAYRYCWVMTFSERAVVESYMNHPDHREYADRHFRPIAGDRVTIDFLPVDGGDR